MYSAYKLNKQGDNIHVLAIVNNAAVNVGVHVVCGFISGFSMLFHWSIFLFLCQFHTVLITVSFKDLRLCLYVYLDGQENGTNYWFLGGLFGDNSV